MAYEAGGIAWGECISLKAVEQSGRAGVKVQIWQVRLRIDGVLKRFVVAQELARLHIDLTPYPEGNRITETQVTNSAFPKDLFIMS